MADCHIYRCTGVMEAIDNCPAYDEGEDQPSFLTYGVLLV